MDYLPDAGSQVRGVRGQQSVQECRTRTRQAGNNDRLLNSRLQNLWCPFLLMPESQKVREETADVPARPEIAEKAQIRLFPARAQQHVQPLAEAHVAEIVHAGAPTGILDQIVRA